MTRNWPIGVFAAGLFALSGFALLLHDVLAPPDDSVAPPAAVAAIAPPAPAAANPAIPPVDPAIYAAIAARPVFAAARRPPPPAPATASPAQAAPPIDFALVGIVKAPDANFAVIQRNGATDATTLRTGDNIGGWRVAAVSSDSILLAWRNTSEVLKLVP